jgi:hypothetical protein
MQASLGMKKLQIMTDKIQKRKILGAIYYPWANFPCFFQKKDSPISIFFLKVIHPNSIE